MQNDVNRGMRTRRHGSAVGLSEETKPKSSRTAGVGLNDVRGSYERYMALARAVGSTGDATEIENYYQHAEHYFRLMKEQAV